MGTKRTFETIRKGVADYRDKGNEAVGIEALLKYLDSLEEELSGDDEIDVSKEAEVERIRATFANQQAQYQWQKEASLAKYNWDKDSSLEMFKSIIAAGQNSMRAAMLMHGGAAIALLAFIGNLADNADTLPQVPNFGGIFPWYLSGLVLVVIAYGTTYLTQSYFSEDKKKHVGERWRKLSCVLVIVSYLTFIAGSWLGYQALMGMPSNTKPEIELSINSRMAQPTNTADATSEVPIMSTNNDLSIIPATSSKTVISIPVVEESRTLN